MGRIPRPLRTLVSLAHDAVATTLEAYTGSSFNLLDYLSSCTDGALFGWIALTRVLLLTLMWLSRTVGPVLFHGPDSSFIFDTGEELYDDPRFAMVRQWDGVHMFFIAHFGYLYENQVVFFPGLPGIIRAVQYTTQQLLPFLNVLAPVSFYVCAMNVLASCFAGVVLRRLSLLSFLGPEAVQCTCQWWKRTGKYAAAAKGSSVAGASGSAPSLLDCERVTEATIRYRLLRGLTGTSLDMVDPLAVLPTTVKQLKAVLRRRRRVAGAAVLLWIFTPSMVFTVAVYTESLFALTTITGVYLMAWYEPLPWSVQERIAAHVPTVVGSNTIITTTITTSLRPPSRHAEQIADNAGNETPPNSAARRADEEALRAPPPLDDLISDVTDGVQHWPTVVWRQAFVTRAELAAVALFTLAATLRSNAFTCAGFFAFPLVVQVFLPSMYEAQCKTVLAGQRAAALLAAAASRRCTPKPAESDAFAAARSPLNSPNAWEGKGVTCTSLTCPHTRFPHPLRLLVVLVECVVLLGPYLSVNYVGYHRFVTTMWTPAAQAQIGKAFWKLYPTLQHKYWNVSFLSAYTFTNLPNVILALPVAVIVVVCTYTYYLRPAWDAQAAAVAAAEMGAPLTRTPPARWTWSRVCAAVAPFVRSSNVVHLLALLTLALSKMHVQVTNRFVMSSPALYWLMGAQLAARPTSLLSQLVLMWSILWSITGGVLFANHLPWT